MGKGRGKRKKREAQIEKEEKEGEGMRGGSSGEGGKAPSSHYWLCHCA